MIMTMENCGFLSEDSAVLWYTYPVEKCFSSV